MSRSRVPDATGGKPDEGAASRARQPARRQPSVHLSCLEQIRDEPPPIGLTQAATRQAVTSSPRSCSLRLVRSRGTPPARGHEALPDLQRRLARYGNRPVPVRMPLQAPLARIANPDDDRCRVSHAFPEGARRGRARGMGCVKVTADPHAIHTLNDSVTCTRQSHSALIWRVTCFRGRYSQRPSLHPQPASMRQRAAPIDDHRSRPNTNGRSRRRRWR